MCRKFQGSNLKTLGEDRLLGFKGAGGGVPWGQIMENEFQYLVDRGGHGGHLA